MAKKDETKKEELAAAVLYQCLETLRIACVLLEPFLPDKMAEVENMALGEGTFGKRVRWGDDEAPSRDDGVPRVEALDEQGLPVVA